MLTVAELIKELDKYPGGLVVSVDGYESGVTDGVNLYIKYVELNKNDEWFNGEHDIAWDVLDKDGQSSSLERKRLVISRYLKDDYNE